MTVILKWVNAFATLVVAVQVSASAIIFILWLLNEKTENEASLHRLGAQILKASGMEVLLICEEE